jgi:filamentous hemagglutinin family protein
MRSSKIRENIKIMKQLWHRFSISSSLTLCSLAVAIPANGQIISDDTTNTNVNQTGNVFEITGGAEVGGNLFHSFQEFSVPTGSEAFFKNPDTIDNIISRVTGGNVSNIDGLISANGIASLNIGGSFFGSTADSIVFPEGEFSATNTQTSPLLTINAPIGLNFRDNPGEIVSESFEFGLEVLPDRTLALIGGDVSIEGGFLLTKGGKIEIGSVAGNNLVNLIQTERGFNVSYEGIENFQDISISQEAAINTNGERGGEINFQGRNVTLTDGSQVISTTLGAGTGGNVRVTASDSVELSGGAELLTATEGNGTAGNIIINTKSLTLTDEAVLSSDVCFELGNCGAGTGGNVKVTASDFVELSRGAILSTSTESDGAAGNLTIETGQLIVQNGAEISTTTFGIGDAGDLKIDASESVEVIGDSRLSAQANENSTGNAGDLTIETKQLIAKNGGQISSATFGNGQGGTLTINASDSILLSGTLPNPDAFGSSAILVSAEVGSTGNGGKLIINTGTLTVEDRARISADTFGTGTGASAILNVDRLVIQDEARVGAGSLIGQDAVDNQRGTGGTLTINAKNSVEVTSNSRLFTLAEGTGDAGDLNITTDKLTVADGGEINASAEGTGAAGNLSIKANSLDLDEGTLTADTAAGTGGNIKLEIDDNITLRNNSSISAKATGTASGGNIDIINPKFILAYPDGNNDILASAEEGLGGRITITDADGIFGIRERPQSNRTNDINATGGVDDGKIIITNPDVDVTQGLVQTPQNVVEPEQTVAQACRSDLTSGKVSGLIIKGKGGIPPLPTEPFDADAILVDGNISNPNPQSQHPEIKPIKTSIGDIYPARGVIVKENGEVILTAYPTDIDRRTPQITAKCN